MKRGSHWRRRSERRERPEQLLSARTATGWSLWARHKSQKKKTAIRVCVSDGSGDNVKGGVKVLVALERTECEVFRFRRNIAAIKL